MTPTAHIAQVQNSQHLTVITVARSATAQPFPVTVQPPRNTDSVRSTRPRRRRTIGLRLALLVTAWLIGLGVGELAVRVAVPQTLSGTWLDQSARGYGVNRAGATAVHRFEDRAVRYRLNADGFRGPELTPKAGARVLVLGDSFTFGLLLRDEDTFVARLASAADRDLGAGRVQWVNAAVGGWGTGDYAAFLEDRGPALEPDVVLVMLNIYDVSRTLNAGLWAWDEDQPGRLVPRQPQHGFGKTIKATVNAVPGYRFLVEHSHLLSLVRRAVAPPVRIGAADLPEPTRAARAEEGPRMARALFERMKAWCDARGARLVVATTGYFQPEDAEFGPLAREFREDEVFQREARSFFAGLAVPFHDVAPDFAAAADAATASPSVMASFRIAGDLHPNEAGAKVIADSLWPWLRVWLSDPR